MAFILACARSLDTGVNSITCKHVPNVTYEEEVQCITELNALT
jgi:hypothetical protein